MFPPLTWEEHRAVVGVLDHAGLGLGNVDGERGMD